MLFACQPGEILALGDYLGDLGVEEAACYSCLEEIIGGGVGGWKGSKS